MSLKKVAEILSQVLGPLFWAPALVIAFVAKGNLSTTQLTILLPSILLLEVTIPLLYIYYFSLKWHLASAWDEPKRQERYPFLILISICFLISLIIIYQFGNLLLFHLEVITIISILTILIITFFWKISLHMCLATLGALIINLLTNWSTPFLFLSIPIIYWARLYLKKHTNLQLIAAFLINSVIILGGFYIFGYLQ